MVNRRAFLAALIGVCAVKSLPIEPPGFTRGTDGFQSFGHGTLALLHGREAVIPDGAGFDRGVDGGDTTVIVFSRPMPFVLVRD